MSKEELVKEAQNLRRYETKTVMDDGKLYLLASTVQSFDDDVEAKLVELAGKIASTYGLLNFDNIKRDYSTDLVSNVRDEFIKFIFDKYGVAEEIYGYEEF